MMATLEIEQDDGTTQTILNVDLRDSISTILKQKHFNLPSDRCTKLQEFGTRLLSAITTEYEEAVSNFSATLLSLFDGILNKASKAKTLSKQREKAWSSFHLLRCTTVVELWKDLLQKLNVDGMNVLLLQSVTQMLFEAIMKVHFYRDTPLKSQLQDNITDDETNIIMYACGYVPVALIRKYEKRSGEKYASYVQCLMHMGIGTFTDTFCDYARIWFEKINRGGAFEVNDAAYNFFIQIEKNTRTYLASLQQLRPEDKCTVVQQLSENEDILFYWSVLSVDVDDRYLTELLQDIVQLWLNIRGYSIAGSWMEQYKQTSGKSAKSRPGLRKGLKKRLSVLYA